MAAPTTDRPGVTDPDLDAPVEAWRTDAASGDSGPSQQPSPSTTPEDDGPVIIPLRPLLAAALSTIAAATVSGGIFGSWFARGLGLFAALFGVGWAWLTLRSRERESTYQLLLVPAALLIGLILVIPAGDGGAANLPGLVRDAISSGRLLRPPVPFDPGWRPILMVLFSLLGFGAAWVGTALDRPRLAIALPLPVLALTAITQPDDGEFIAGLCAFIPLLAALAVLFGGDSMKASELTRDFELKRAVRAVAAGFAAVVALVVLSNASFLFPEPVYDPSDQPQKPRPIPLSAIEDRVLFEIRTDSAITGPWKTGALDIYDGTAWKLPPFDKDRFIDLPADGVVNPQLAPIADQVIEITLRGLGDATALPVTTSTAKVDRPPELNVKWDPRVHVLRVPEGRAPADVSYRVSMPPYPNAEVLSVAPPPVGNFTEQLQIPKPPGTIARLLEEAPQQAGWARLDFLRKRLREVAVATGGGVPKDITPSRVAEIFEDQAHEASPYEIVAAEAMLARWAGVPSRIGFGFDGFNDEAGVHTVRPANAAQWLEVYFEGQGWVPLIEAPEQAKQTLDNEDDAKFDPNTVASDEVAVDLYIPLKVDSIRLLYERLRARVLAVLPLVALALAAYLSTPTVMRQWRRSKRRRWAIGYGPRTQIAVEYAEFRDAAHDLNVGDPLDTPLEYLQRVVPDAEHQEFAWLVSRAMYGDLARGVTDADAVAAEELSSSLRRRMSRGQPFQARALAALSRASLRQPYTDEVPNVVLLDPLGRFARWRRARRIARKAAPRRRTGWLPVRLPRFRVPVLLGGKR
jgi:hypothetical protein